MFWYGSRCLRTVLPFFGCLLMPRSPDQKLRNPGPARVFFRLLRPIGGMQRISLLQIDYRPCRDFNTWSLYAFYLP